MTFGGTPNTLPAWNFLTPYVEDMFMYIYIYFVLAWSLRKASNVLSESYCQNGLAILAQALCQQTLESLKFALLPSPLRFAFQLWPLSPLLPMGWMT